MTALTVSGLKQFPDDHLHESDSRVFSCREAGTYDFHFRRGLNSLAGTFVRNALPFQN